MTKIELSAGGKTWEGILNETLAAKDFAKRLPFSATCRKNPTEYYCSSANGIFEPMELQLGYQAGDLIQWDGWFFVAYKDAEEAYQQQYYMVIGKLAEPDTLESESDSIKIKIMKQED